MTLADARSVAQKKVPILAAINSREIATKSSHRRDLDSRRIRQDELRDKPRY
ncbi:hypothetical protein BRPE64_ACDS28820 [Caballeronia insecticola]|uniref:Uncharacterized protein n=1 Tax=Caballeronia insecticola TaxID=758793 RepID=R4WZ17_9BURK|nr:hypothetical protein BRPE64_ACDS28820 [Caballeronia insecticola]